MTERDVRLKTPASYKDTQVPIQRSVGHIESVLAQFGCEATSTAIARRGEEALCEIRFAYANRTYSIRLCLGEDPQQHRQRMRLLFWYVKATLEAVVFEVVTAEEALLPYAEIVDGAGRRTTVARLLGDRFPALPEASAEAILGAVSGRRALPAPISEERTRRD